MFEKIEAAPPDPILGLMDAFRADPNPRKINLSVGVYQDDSGKTPILASVKRAEEAILASETTKEYFSIAGHPAFGNLIPPLVLGGNEKLLQRLASTTIQTPGGTGGLRVIADFLKDVAPQATVWMTDPTWPNHPGIFQGAGLTIKSFPYLDATKREVAIDPLLAGLANAAPGDAVLLHGCCHNPTGCDINMAQWVPIVELCAEKKLLPIIDLAYLGFADGLVADTLPIQAIVEKVPTFVCVSFSKNFGLYRERVGAVVYLGENAAEAEIVASRLKRCVRINYSNPPAHGGSVVARVLGTALEREAWILDVDGMRNRLHALRQAFADALGSAGFPRDVRHLPEQKGMFSMLELSPAEVDRLRSDFGIYILRSGRVNFAGMRHDNVKDIAEAFVQVAKGK